MKPYERASEVFKEIWAGARLPVFAEHKGELYFVADEVHVRRLCSWIKRHEGYKTADEQTKRLIKNIAIDKLADVLTLGDFDVVPGHVKVAKIMEWVDQFQWEET